MTKIVLILTNSINGLHSFRKEVMKAIVDNGYKVVISVPELTPKADYFREIGCDVVLTCFNRRGMNPVSDIKQVLAYRKLMKHLKPVAVLTYTIKPNIYGGIAARICHVPQLANITGLGDAIENGGWLQKLTVGLYKIGLGKAKQVFFQNETNRSFCIQKGVARASSILIPGSGVNLQHHTYQEYPTNNGTIRFLFIGRLLKDKGIDELLDTAKFVRSKYSHTEFQIVGSVDGDYKKQVDEMTEAGVIRFLGRQEDVRPFIGAVHCTIMPSYHEGMSNVNLESAANGRPVITTNVPGCRETIEDGKTGFLCEAKNADSLINAVERFITLSYEQKKSMGKKARKKMELEFDRNIVVRAYLDEIKNISNV